MEGLMEPRCPTFEAVGSRSDDLRAGVVWDNFLISRAIDSAEPLDEFLTGTFQQLAPRTKSRIRRDLSRSLGQLAGRMHQAGVLQKDFHSGNILVRILPDQSLRLWIIDLHTIGLDRTPSLALVKENFAVFPLSSSSTRSRRRTGLILAGHTGRFARSTRAHGTPIGCRRRAPSFDRRLGGPPPQHHSRIRSTSLSTREAANGAAVQIGTGRALGNRHLIKVECQCHELPRDSPSSPQSDLLTELRDNPESLFARNVKIWCKTDQVNIGVAGLVLPIAGP